MVSFDEPVENAWMRARGRCECGKSSHDHHGRCECELVWEHRGHPFAEGAWEAYHSNPLMVVEWEATQRCRILCWSCYVETMRANVSEDLNLASRRPYARLVVWPATA